VNAFAKLDDAIDEVLCELVRMRLQYPHGDERRERLVELHDMLRDARAAAVAAEVPRG